MDPNKRNLHIMVRLSRGESQADIARDLGLSRERVRQIARAGGAPSREVKVLQRSQAAAQWVAEGHGARSLTAAIARFKTTRPKVLEVLAEMGIDYEQTRHEWLLAKHAARARGEGEARCHRCKKTKPWIEMRSDVKTIGGERVVTRQALCLDCNTAITRAWLTENKGKYTEPTVTQKRCSHCQKVKPANQFYRSTSSTTGLQSWCRVCQKGSR